MTFSPRTPRVVAARRLQRRRDRDRAGRFLAEGPQAVRSALAAGVVRELFGTDAALARHADLAAEAPLVSPVTEEAMAALAETVHPQGLVAVCEQVDVPLAGALPKRLVAVAVDIRDPGNAGTVVRAADAAGAGGVVLTDASVDVFNPKCVRASAGSLFHLPVATGVPLEGAVGALRDAGLVVLAADVAGTADLDDLQDLAARGEGPLVGPVAWVFGNEAWGLPDDTLAAADTVVRVPVHGRAESLNLATAATLCLYATARAHRPGAKPARARTH